MKVGAVWAAFHNTVSHLILSFSFRAAVFRAVIETPRGCRLKYKLDPGTGALTVDHVLTGATVYPANYGFLPRTLSADNFALDVLV